MPIQLGFILRRLAAMAEADPSLRERQPWKAAYERDSPGWAAIIKHYHGDDSDLQLLWRRPRMRSRAGPSRSTRRGGRVPPRAPATRRSAARYATAATADGRAAPLPRGQRVRTYIASGGDRDFMRPISHDLYGIPPERVIGSSNGLRYQEDERRRRGRLPGRAGRLRRRPGQADPHLEPHRAPPAPRRRQLERRHPDAALRRRPERARAADARPPRRRRARVRLHRGRRAGPRAGRRRTAGRWSASATTGRRSSPDGRRRDPRGDVHHGVRSPLPGGGACPRGRGRPLPARPHAGHERAVRGVRRRHGLRDRRRAPARSQPTSPARRRRTCNPARWSSAPPRVRWTCGT